MGGTRDVMRARILSCYDVASVSEEKSVESTVNDVEKSINDEDIEKGRKSTNFGSHSKDGKYIKTTQGWKRVEVHQANGGDVEAV